MNWKEHLIWALTVVAVTVAFSVACVQCDKQSSETTRECLKNNSAPLCIHRGYQ